MNFDEFTHRFELAGAGEAVRSVRTTLRRLGQRMPTGNGDDRAAPLPMDIEWYLTGTGHGHGPPFDWAEVVSRLVDIDGMGRSAAACHARDSTEGV